MGPLDGVRVLEAGLLVQGPQAALTMQEWGAEVIKIELPGFGDQSRWLPIDRQDRRSAFFMAYNRGKRSMTIDLRVPRGREVFLRLVEDADVVITNFKPGTMDAWGSATPTPPPATTGSSMRWAPPSGPRAQMPPRRGRPQCAGGRRADQHDGWQGRRPQRDRCHHRRPHRGAESPLGHPGRAVRREHTGRGQLVETSLLGGQVWAQAGEYTRYLLSGEVSGPSGRSHPMIPGIYGVFPTADGWIAIVGTAGPARDVFYRTIGRPDLIERFNTLLYFEEDKAALWPILDEVFATKPTASGARCSVPPACALPRSATTPRSRPIRASRQRLHRQYHRSRHSGYLRRGGQGAVRFSEPVPAATPGAPGTWPAHRGGAARVRLLVGRHRGALGGRRHLGARLRTRSRSAPPRG